MRCIAEFLLTTSLFCLSKEKMNTRKKRVAIISVVLLLVITAAVVGILYYYKPTKAKLVTGLDNAFEYYRSGGTILPPVSFYPDAYQQQYWLVDGHQLTMREYMLNNKREENMPYHGGEGLSHFDRPPSDLIIPDMITINDFVIKRPHREVLVVLDLDGYKAHCTMEYMRPYVMEWFPPSSWQVASLTFFADSPLKSTE